MKKTILAALAALTLTTPAAASNRVDGDAKLERLLAGRVAGQPTRCIATYGNTSTQIIDGKALVFRVGSKLYVNQPRSGASTLNDDDILVTRTFGNRLCNIDTVNLVDRTSRFWSGFIVLGDFVPYTKARG
jgi:hypothetical protein